MILKRIELLKEIGLTQTEAKVYLTLLNLNSSLAGNIASKSNLYRKNVYDALNSLLQKGLVSYKIQNRKKYWICLEPERILSIIQDKINKFEYLLPTLTNEFNKKIETTNVEVYEGLEGVKHTIEFMMKQKNAIYLLGATGKIFTKLEYLIENVAEVASKTKSKIYFLLNDDLRNKKEGKLFQAKGKKLKNFYYKFMPKNLRSETQIYIFGGYSIVFTWEDKPISVLIKNKNIARGFKSYFDFLWKLSSKN